MATPTPWAVAARRAPTLKRTFFYTYDPYNFSHVTAYSGFNPRVVVPATGPHAIGAPPPTSARQIAFVEVMVVEPGPPSGYGNNLGGPGA